MFIQVIMSLDNSDTAEMWQEVTDGVTGVTRIMEHLAQTVANKDLTGSLKGYSKLGDSFVVVRTEAIEKMTVRLVNDDGSQENIFAYTGGMDLK